MVVSEERQGWSKVEDSALELAGPRNSGHASIKERGEGAEYEYEN